MKPRLLLFTLLLGASSAFAEPVERSFVLVNNSAQKIGQVVLIQGTQGVLVTISAQGLPPGYHGMHFHNVGDCSDTTQFMKAGGHVDPHKKPHGYLHPAGPHEGNLPNLIVPADGSVRVELYTQMVSLDNGEAKLLDEDGSALIIHANRDDHISQPIGGAGGRIACAELH